MGISTESLPITGRTDPCAGNRPATALVPGRLLLKEWAYPGAFFGCTGAIVSHLATGYDVAEVGMLAILTALTMLSWALRLRGRRTPRAAPPRAR
jgi:hypothetical protein